MEILEAAQMLQQAEQNLAEQEVKLQKQEETVSKFKRAKKPDCASPLLAWWRFQCSRPVCWIWICDAPLSTECHFVGVNKGARLLLQESDRYLGTGQVREANVSPPTAPLRGPSSRCSIFRGCASAVTLARQPFWGRTADAHPVPVVAGLPQSAADR